MNSIISSNINEIRNFFRSHKITKVYVFGSVVSGGFNENSDLDFLVTFKPGLSPLEKGELWWNLHDTLRNFFKREIDILTENSLKNPYLIKELNETKELIYEE